MGIISSLKSVINFQASDSGLNDLLRLEQTIGYEFKNPDLLIEALTHPSFDGKSAVEIIREWSFLVIPSSRVKPKLVI